MVEGAGLGKVEPLQPVSGAALESVLSFIYTGKCELESQDALVSILEAAAFLGMPVLCKAAESAIASRISRDSCVASVQLAQRYNLDELAKVSMLECRRNITKLDDQIGALSIRDMRILLGQSYLAVTSEEDVFFVVDTWWQAQAQKPSPTALKALLRCVRCRLLTSAFIEMRVLPAPWMQPAEMKDELINILAADPIQPPLPRDGVEPENVVGDSYDWAIPRFSRLLDSFRRLGTLQTLQSPVFKLHGYNWYLMLHIYPADAEHESERTGIFLYSKGDMKQLLLGGTGLPRSLNVASCSLRLRNLRSPQSDVVKTSEIKIITCDEGKGFSTFAAPSTLAEFCAGNTLMISVLFKGPVTEPSGSAGE